MSEHIVKFLEANYSDEQLAALLAHTQDGKMGYYSCCCLVGIVNAPHALVPAVTEDDYPEMFGKNPDIHVNAARDYPFAFGAEFEFFHLGKTDAERRENLLPLILAEQERRAKLKTEPEALLVAASVAQ